TATVRLDYGPDQVAVCVIDDGTAVPGKPGNGIIGMRERARALHGRFSCGPEPGGGFAVRAWLPTAATARGVRTDRDEDCPVIRVLIADDPALIRLGLRVLPDSTDGFVVGGAAAAGREAVRLTRSLRPHAVLMDIRMPRKDGLAALREITADPALQDTRVIMLTTFEVDEYIFEALRDGASGFLIKDGDPEDVPRAISAA